MKVHGGGGLAEHLDDPAAALFSKLVCVDLALKPRLLKPPATVLLTKGTRDPAVPFLQVVLFELN